MLSKLSFQETFYEWSREENGIKRHAGVLALSAVVKAFPYSVPSFLPKILMQLCRHTCDKQPMQVSFLALLKISI